MDLSVRVHKELELSFGCILFSLYIPEATGIVCPSSLRKNVFTTMAVDNIAHNPSSATVAGSFHGTAISVVQHPSAVREGTELEQPAFFSTARKSITIAWTKGARTRMF